MSADAWPGVLVIAGLDPSGGAGLVADIRVCEQLHCRPMAIATALTEQTTVGVREINAVSSTIVGDQLRMILTDVEVSAVKIGMLANDEIAEEVADALDLTGAPVVWDPVLQPTAGRVLLYEGDPRRVFERFAERVALCTPNAPEATMLTGIAIASLSDAIKAGQALCDRGVAAALIKGGHWDGGDEVVDVLVTAAGPHVMSGRRIPTTESVHGTGCALATAIACQLARGVELVEACRFAKTYVASLIAVAVRPGRGRAGVL